MLALCGAAHCDVVYNTVVWRIVEVVGVVCVAVLIYGVFELVFLQLALRLTGHSAPVTSVFVSA